jgi:hypothetical protein
MNTGTSPQSTDIGFIFNRANGLVANASLYWSETNSTFVTAFTANSGITSGNIVPTDYANLVVANLTGTLLTAAQPYITSMGTINGLTTSGPVSLSDTTVNGNLVVNGNVTTINSIVVTTNDLNITLANNAINAQAADGGGITLGGASASMRYTAATNTWDFNIPLVANAFVGSGASLTGVAGNLSVASAVVVTGSAQPTITSVGTMTGLTLSGPLLLSPQLATTVFAGPVNGGTSPATPGFRQIVQSDIVGLTAVSAPTFNNITLTTATANGFLFSGNASTLGSVAALDGQLLIGRTNNTPIAASLTPGFGIAITSTTGNVTVASNGATPQRIITGSYTLVDSDNGATVIINNETAAVIITLPTGRAAGIKTTFIQQGTGDVTFAPAAGVTINSPYAMRRVRAQNYAAYVEQIGTSNVYQLLGKIRA